MDIIKKTLYNKNKQRNTLSNFQRVVFLGSNQGNHELSKAMLKRWSES